MSDATRTLIAAEIAAARASARGALATVALFVAWLLVTWLGPAFEPEGGYTLALSAVCLGGYSLLTIGTLVALLRGAGRLVRAGVLRRVVTAHLAPFWLVAVAAAVTGGAVWCAASDPFLAVWLGVGTTLAILTSGYAAARILEASQLSEDCLQLSFAPSEAATRTWKRELATRLRSS